LRKKCKESAKNTNFSQEMTKSAQFLQKNTKKYQFFTIFLPHSRPKPTQMRQIGMAVPELFEAQISPKPTTLRNTRNTNFLPLNTSY